MADILADQLIRMGFVVQRYDAYTTDSIYLKLDYGVCNSIRISDHPGKKYLKYRYNIGPFVKHRKTVQDKFQRHYFPIDQWRKMLQKIEKDREDRIRRYGMNQYQKYMDWNKDRGNVLPGFWQKAYLVERSEEACF